MSFAFTIDQAHLPQYQKYPHARAISGPYMAFFEAPRAQAEWEGTAITAHDTGLLHGTARDGRSECKIHGIAYPLFLITQKGSDGRVGMLAGTPRFEAPSVVVEGVWRPPGSDAVGAFNLFRVTE
jgi:hypothetical protein